jgi:hypothetical protein
MIAALLAMQKVEGSSPFSRTRRIPDSSGYWLHAGMEGSTANELDHYLRVHWAHEPFRVPKPPKIPANPRP